MRLQVFAASQALGSAMPSTSSRASTRASSRSSGRLRTQALLLRAHGAAATVQLAHADLGFSLSFSSGLTLHLPPPKDLAVGHALGEVFEGDAAHGAELLD